MPRRIPNPSKPRELPAREYVVYSPDGVASDTLDARCELALATIRVMPEFFDALVRLQPRFRFLQAKARGRSREYWSRHWSFGEWEERCERLHRNRGVLAGEEPFRQPLLSWAKSFNVDTQTWMLEGALKALSDYEPGDFRRRDVANVFRKSLPLARPGGPNWSGEFAFRMQAWRPSIESRSEYFNRLVARFNRRVAAFMRLQKTGLPIHTRRPFRFVARPWEPLAERWEAYRASLQSQFARELTKYERVGRAETAKFTKRSRKKWSVRHFEWFARCQFGGENPVMLAAERLEAPRDATTVPKALRSIGDLVGWQGPIKHLRTRNGK